MRSHAADRVSIHRPIVWIVDANRSDYNHLLAEAQAERLKIHFLATGRELLHDWSAGAPDVCIVNLQVREFSGFDVVEMIRPFPEGTVVCLLTDAYAAEDEIRALSLGVHSYLCKPLEAAVFFDLCRSRGARNDRAAKEAAMPSIGLFIEEEFYELGTQERRLSNQHRTIAKSEFVLPSPTGRGLG
ncbi:MAG: response regulator [Pirellulales bacterium]|nr:response regulator [Pirellulales bacterium]